MSIHKIRFSIEYNLYKKFLDTFLLRYGYYDMNKNNYHWLYIIVL